MVKFRLDVSPGEVLLLVPLPLPLIMALIRSETIKSEEQRRGVSFKLDFTSETRKLFGLVRFGSVSEKKIWLQNSLFIIKNLGSTYVICKSTIYIKMSWRVFVTA